MISISSAIILSIIVILITYVKRQERIKKLEAVYSVGCCGVKLEKMTLKKKSELLDLIGYAYAICFISIL